jgi:response regulator RpfG family c-di-GMP phosphodiesterase
MTATPPPAPELLPGLSNRLIGDQERKRILLVDDEETIRRALGRFLVSRGYDVDTAGSAQEALDLITPGRYAIMICDVRMPGMTGLELLPRARERDPDVGIMMLTAVNDTPTAAESLSLGAMEYLMKPIELGELQLAVERVLHRRNLALEHRNVERIIQDEVDRRTVALRRDRYETFRVSAEALAVAVARFEARDPNYAGMSARVATLASSIAEALHLAPGLREAITLAGRLHDVGRIALPDSILTKAGSLTPAEFDRMQDHVQASLEILAPLSPPPDVADAVRDHHEHWNGTGYPRGIAGNAISIGGRILCTADVFVALTSPRLYRGAMSESDALSYLTTQSGTLLDPAVFAALRDVVTNQRVLGLTAG